MKLNDCSSLLQSRSSTLSKEKLAILNSSPKSRTHRLSFSKLQCNFSLQRSLQLVGASSSYTDHGRQKELDCTRQLGFIALLCVYDFVVGRSGVCSCAQSATGWYVPIDQIVVDSTTSMLLTNRFADDVSAENPNDSDSGAVPTVATEPIKNATTASNGTVKASSPSSAAAVATTASSPLNSTNDPNMCHKTFTTDPEGATYTANPFCKPSDGQEVYPNIRTQGKSQLECPVESKF